MGLEVSGVLICGSVDCQGFEVVLMVLERLLCVKSVKW